MKRMKLIHSRYTQEAHRFYGSSQLIDFFKNKNPRCVCMCIRYVHLVLFSDATFLLAVHQTQMEWMICRSFFILECYKPSIGLRLLRRALWMWCEGFFLLPHLSSSSDAIFFFTLRQIRYSSRKGKGKRRIKDEKYNRSILFFFWFGTLGIKLDHTSTQQMLCSI